MNRFLKDSLRKCFPVFAVMFAVSAAFYFLVAVIVNRTAEEDPSGFETATEENTYDLSSFFDKEDSELRDYCYTLPDMFQKSLNSGNWEEILKSIDSQHLYERCSRTVNSDLCMEELNAIRNTFSSPSCTMTSIETDFHGKSSPDAIVQLSVSDSSLNLSYTLYVYRRDAESFGFFFQEMESGKFGAVYTQ